MKHQITSANNQIITNVRITKIGEKVYSVWEFGRWSLFGVWDLVIGI
jgi:hypothetical protein